MGVSAVVVTFNRLKLLKECLSNLINQTYRLDYIFVVNNNSTDGTKTYLEHLNNNQIIPINLNENTGGAGGFNSGLKYAFEHSNSSYFWIMDDDTMPTSKALEVLMDKSKLLHGNFGFLCSNVRWWKDNAPSNVPTVSNDWSKLSQESLIKVRYATFVSVLIPRNNVAKYGLPIKQMFIWGDDTEYTTRLSSKHNCYFVPDSIVFHKSAVNTSYETVYNASMKRLNNYKCMYRNLVYIGKKYYPLKYRVKDLLRFTYHIFEALFKAKDYRLTRTLVIIKSICKGLTFNPKIEFPQKHNKLLNKGVNSK